MVTSTCQAALVGKRLMSLAKKNPACWPVGRFSQLQYESKPWPLKSAKGVIMFST